MNLLLAHLLNGWRLDPSAAPVDDDRGHWWVPLVPRRVERRYVPLYLAEPVPFDHRRDER